MGPIWCYEDEVTSARLLLEVALVALLWQWYLETSCFLVFEEAGLCRDFAILCSCQVLLLWKYGQDKTTKQWIGKGEPIPKKANSVPSIGKVVATVSGDVKGIVLVLLEKGRDNSHWICWRKLGLAKRKVLFDQEPQGYQGDNQHP